MFGIIFWASLAFIVYVYAGYPLLVALLASFKKPRVVHSASLPSITLIFAAFNEEKVMAQKLQNSLALDYPEDLFQVLVADDGSTDRTAEIIRSFEGKGVELVQFETRRGKSAALKDVVKQARGEILLFSDADNFYPPDCLREVAAAFTDPSVGAVSGGRNVVGDTLLGAAEGFYWKYEEFIKRQESRLGSCVGVAGDLLAVRRSLYVPPPVGIINDDFYQALSVLKQGRRVVYVPKARSYHPVAGSEQEEVERRARMVAGRYQVMFSTWRILPFRNLLAVWQILSHKYFRPLVPLAMILALAASLCSVLFAPHSGSPTWLLLAYPYNWAALAAQLAFYLIAGLSMKYRLKGWLGKALYVPTFLVNSNLAALAGLYRYLTSTQTVSWKKAAR